MLSFGVISLADINLKKFPNYMDVIHGVISLGTIYKIKLGLCLATVYH